MVLQNSQVNLKETMTKSIGTNQSFDLRARLSRPNCDRATNFSTSLQPRNTQRTRPLICLPLLSLSSSQLQRGGDNVLPKTAASHAFSILIGDSVSNLSRYHFQTSFSRMSVFNNGLSRSALNTTQICAAAKIASTTEKKGASLFNQVSTVMPLITCGEAWRKVRMELFAGELAPSAFF